MRKESAETNRLNRTLKQFQRIAAISDEIVEDIVHGYAVNHVCQCCGEYLEARLSDVVLQPDIFDRLLPIGFEVKSIGILDDPSSEIENSLLIHIGWVEHVHHCRAQWSPLVPT